MKDSANTDRFGIDVRQRHVLDIDESNPRATIVADLAAARGIDPDQFDCFILIQTLQCVPDPVAAIRHAYRILRRGGVLLASVPGLSLRE